MRNIADRITHWRTSAAGVATTGVLVYVFRSLDCKVPADWLTWIAATLPTVLGLLSKDR